MARPGRVLRIPTERPWSWAPFKKLPERAPFPPLKILFCGSDHFSAPSFDMLRELHLRRDDIVSDLAVITPADRRSGRGMRTAKPCPLTILARRTRVPCTHVSRFHLDVDDLPPASDDNVGHDDGGGTATATGTWDLIVAVSFGHKITPAVLDRTTFGGLNVHPSLLPRHRGPAPLHHALLNADRETGVSLQTLHPTEFDRGRVLMRSPPIPLDDHTTLDALYAQTARLGADMLRELLVRGYPGNAAPALQQGQGGRGVETIGVGGEGGEGASADVVASHAPKLKRDEMRIHWRAWSVAKIVRWSRVLKGACWTVLADGGDGDGNDEKVVKLHDLQPLDASRLLLHHHHGGSRPPLDPEPGALTLLHHDRETGSSRTLVVACSDGHVRVGRLTVAGKGEKPGGEASELDGRRFLSPPAP